MVDEEDPNYSEWMKIFEHFQKGKDTEEDEEKKDAGKEGEDNETTAEKKAADDSDEEEDADGKKLSRKKWKLLNRLSIAELKQMVKRPDVVEVWDVTSHDPRLLVFLKAYRNAVPVPRHWCNKRKYLVGKRGIDKEAFKLPDFIEATGIAKLRAAYEEKESEKTMKQKARQQSRPKMSKMDIDYQVLHDAFFRFQTKPKLLQHGDIYFEGKEFEVQMTHLRPGVTSEVLKLALGMPPDGVPVPPPWLINMQRYGPPPSYPNLKVPGLNAPIPGGAQFGYHPGGWGKPPVDEFGRPLYGDVFGAAAEEEEDKDAAPVEKKWWGEIEEAEEDEDEDEDDDEEEEAGDEDAEMDGITSLASGLETPASSGLESFDVRKNSVMGGTETPDSSMAEFNIRKDKSLYQVISQEDAKVGQELLGSSFKYNVNDPNSAAVAAAKKDKNLVALIKNQSSAGVEVTIDASELEGMDASLLQEKYESTVAGQKNAREDVSDVFEEQAKKRKKPAAGKDSKKYKDYAW
mmetsp:Transcript_22765/g.54443  ORF Transcript_22765/g.54443 Transcript_22765/m.54443 type:complete len:516 (-) Transcript_22765:166-1713(-)